MKPSIFLLILLSVSIVQADIIKCVFTEPFFNTTYNTDDATLTYDNYDGEIVVMSKVSFQIKSAAVFELVASDGKVLQTLLLNNAGSDGMSDIIYPFDVKSSSQRNLTYAVYGGCTSSNLKSAVVIK